MVRSHTGRVIIVGAGLAALFAALKLAPKPVLMISPEPLGHGASSAWAQGGVAAAMSKNDSPEKHAIDTERAGAGTVDPAIARLVTQEARDHVLDLTTLGTPFDRSLSGDYVLSREAAHSYARVVRVKGDQAGAAIMAALIEQVRNTPSIEILEGFIATRLKTSNGTAAGIEIQRAAGVGPTRILTGPAYVLAGGGSGGLYAVTTNPPRVKGEVIGLAARAGAAIADAEFVQFHPTAIDVGEDPAPLATEALRGEGAILVNKNGQRFMLELHPDAELAPRDIVARGIFEQSQLDLRPMLDTRQALGPRILDEFPVVAEACKRNGIDPINDPIPVAAAAHYHMGGISCDKRGRSSLDGVWVCGEASSTGLHGANRLASNGLLEALVFARRCALDIRATIPISNNAPFAKVTLPASETSARTPLVSRLRETMSKYVGVIRSQKGLETALRTIAELETELPDDQSFLNMTATATLIAAAALKRQESRGAHARTDYPEFQTDNGLRSLVTLKEALQIRSSLT